MPSSGSSAPPRRQPFSFSPFIAAALILLAVVVTYGNSLHVPFLLDDELAIVANPSLHRFATIFSPPADLQGLPISGRPLTNASFGASFLISGLDVAGYHIANIAVHAACALLLFGLVRLTFLQPSLGSRFGRDAGLLGFTVALLWSVHPLLTESVTYISQRAEAQVALFFLLTLYAVARGLSAGPMAWRWSVLAIAAAVAGMLTKEVMAAAPLSVALYLRAVREDSWRNVFRHHRRLLLGLASSWVVLGILVLAEHGARGASAGFGLGVSAYTYLLTQCHGLVVYLKLCLWPHPLILDYGTGLVTGLADVAAEATVIVALLVATAWMWRRHHVIAWVATSFFLILAPSSSFVPLVGQTLAEHRMYLPLAAVVGLGVTAAYLVLGRQGLLCAIAAIAVALGTVTSRRNVDYTTPLRIWTDTVAKLPTSARAHNNLGWALQQSGRHKEALAEYEQAVRVLPSYVSAQYNWGALLLEIGRPQEALLHLETAVRDMPGHLDARVNLGTVLLQVGRPEDALAQFAAVLKARPTADVHYNTAIVLRQLGRTREAIDHLEAALALEPGLAAAHYELGSVAHQSGDQATATAAWTETLHVDPSNQGALRGLGLLAAQANDLDRAEVYFQKLLRLAPEDVDARANLGNVFLLKGNPRAAAECFEAALRQRPADRRLQESLATAREAQR